MSCHARPRWVVLVSALLVSLHAGSCTGRVWAQAEVSFLARQDFRVGGGPVSVAVGDFNGDGHLDLATANINDDTVSIMLGQGDGRFVAAPAVDVGVNPRSMAVGDFNGDGHLDLAVVNSGAGISAGTVSIMLGQGDGRFVAAPAVEVGTSPRSMAVGDFNGDGHLDLAVVNNRDGTVSILLGQGDGRFVAAPAVGVGGFPSYVAVGDFNGDGHLDLAVEESIGNTVAIMLGQGNGHFVAATHRVGVGQLPLFVVVGDFNSDGRLDLATANFDADTVSIVLNTTAVGVNTLVTFVPRPDHVSLHA